MSLPGRVVDLTIHESFFFHFADNVINFFVVLESINNSFMFGDIFVHEIKTFGHNLELIDNLFKFERH